MASLFLQLNNFRICLKIDNNILSWNQFSWMIYIVYVANCRATCSVFQRMYSGVKVDRCFNSSLHGLDKSNSRKLNQDLEIYHSCMLIR